MSSFAYTVTPKSINILLNGRMRTIDQTHLNYAKVADALKAWGKFSARVMPKIDYDVQYKQFIDRLAELVDIKTFIAKVTAGKVRIGDNAVFYGDVEVKQVIAERLIELLKGGHDVRPLARFLDRLMTNPTKETIDHLYLFLEKNGVPITPDGCFLAFKKVTSEYLSYHANPDGTFHRHRIGDKPTMNREDVDPSRNQTCSRGLHFCSYDYLPSYYGGEGRVVVLKIAPEDVVAIPYDYSNAKGRAWTYEVVDEVPEDEAAKFFYDRPIVKDYSKEAWTDESAAQIAEKAADAVDELAAKVDTLAAEAESGVEAELEAEEILDAAQAMGDAVPNVGDPGDACNCAYCVDDEPIEMPHSDVIPDDETYSDLEADADAMLADVSIPDTPAPKKPSKFEHGGKTYTAKKITDLVAKHGQRGTCNLTGIPRSTLQGWLKKII